MEALFLTQRFERAEEIPGGKTRLRLFTGEIHLDQSPNGPAALPAQRCEACGEIQAVHGVDEVEERDGLPCFVRLEVADQMPLEAQLSQFLELGDLWGRLLDTILAEKAQARLKRLLDCGSRMGLADGQKRNLLRLSTGARRRPGDPLPNGGDAVGDHFFFRACTRAWAVATF